MRDEWHTDFALTTVFQPLSFALAPLLKLNAWPSLNDYQAYVDAHINPLLASPSMAQAMSPPATSVNAPIEGMIPSRLRIVAQDAKAKSFEQTYLARIYQRGEIQTRLHNWHDLFQILSWRLFPRSKASLVRRHYVCAKQRWQQQQQGKLAPGRRSVEENALSLWDEGGLLLLCADQDFPALVRQFRWRELFLQRRDQLRRKLRMLVFGHALLDKLRHPYIGMTGNAILLPLPDQALTSNEQDLFAFADEQLASLLAHDLTTAHTQAPAVMNDNENKPPSSAQTPGYTPWLRQPRDLQPFPVLGMPGLWPDNETPAFYDNSGYFRPGRGQARAT